MKSIFTILTLTTILAFSSLIKAGDYALDGYCPVCYLAANKAAKGLEEFHADHNGKTYLFVSAEVRDTFVADPEKYLPEYDGLCAYGMSLGKKFDSDPTVFTVSNGRVFLNKDAEIGKLFQKDTESHIVKADEHWASMSKKFALGGYCPVCYLAANKAAKGLEEFQADHGGKTYLFVSAEVRDTFVADPEKYLPEFDGLCAYGMALGKKFDSDPTVFTVNDGRVFLNKDAEIGKLFQKDTASLIVKADEHWASMSKEMKGSDKK